MNSRAGELNGRSSVTIYDIAEQVGLSPSTVNRALNGTGRVSKETRERVRGVAASLGYQPSLVARSLRSSRTNTIGVVVPLLGESSFSPMVQGIERAAYDRSYNIIVCTTECERDRELHYYDLLYQRRVDGIIVAPLSPRGSDQAFSELLDLESQGIPVVAMEQSIPEQRLSRVEMDNFGGAKMLTRHLIGLGHTRIGYAHVGLTAWSFSGLDRIAGYEAALTETGIELDASLVTRLTEDEMNVRNESSIAGSFVSYVERVRPTAVFVHHDMLAMKALQACAAAGIRVPEDLAVVGFDDILSSAYAVPALTTVHQPSLEIGQRSAEILFERIECKSAVHVHERIPGRLVVRKSCGAGLSSGQSAWAPVARDRQRLQQ